MEKIKAWVACFLYRIYMWAKRRSGFVSYGRYVTVTGTVLAFGQGKQPSDDGDITFYLKPDPEYDYLRWVRGFGVVTRETQDPAGPPGTLVCELTPCDKTWVNWYSINVIQKKLLAGELPRVRVTGEEAFDGVEVHGFSWESVKRFMWGTAPNFNVGWKELHPVTDILVLG